MDKQVVARARGLGIIAVVYGHASPGYWIPVYLFHMPLFFLLGGLGMSRDRSWRQIFRFVLVDMLLFAVAATAFYQLVALALDPLVPSYHRFGGFELSYFTTDILVYSGHHVTLALTTWFLVAYAGATLLAELVVRLVPPHLEMRLLPVVAAILLVAGFEVLAPLFRNAREHWYLNQLSQICVGSAFMLAGYLLQRAERLLKLLFHPITLVATVSAFAGIALGVRPSVPSMAFSDYPLGLGLFVLCSSLGIACVLQLAFALKAPALAWLAALGRASKHVMIHHLFIFALINFAFVAAGVMAIDDIVDVYSKFEPRSTWLLYTILGVVLPWLGIAAWKRLSTPAGQAPAKASNHVPAVSAGTPPP